MFGNLCISLVSEIKTLENIICKILGVNPLGCFVFLPYQRLWSENSDLHKIYRIFNSIKNSKRQAIRIAGNYHVLLKSAITWDWSVCECNTSLVESLRFYIKKYSVWQGKITRFQVIIIHWKSRDAYVVVCWNREQVCFIRKTHLLFTFYWHCFLIYAMSTQIGTQILIWKRAYWKYSNKNI